MVVVDVSVPVVAVADVVVVVEVVATQTLQRAGHSCRALSPSVSAAVQKLAMLLQFSASGLPLHTRVVVVLVVAVAVVVVLVAVAVVAVAVAVAVVEVSVPVVEEAVLCLQELQSTGHCERNPSPRKASLQSSAATEVHGAGSTSPLHVGVVVVSVAVVVVVPVAVVTVVLVELVDVVVVCVVVVVVAVVVDLVLVVDVRVAVATLLSTAETLMAPWTRQSWIPVSP